MCFDDKDVRFGQTLISRRLSMADWSTIVDTHFRDGHPKISKCSRRDTLLLPMQLGFSSFINKEEVEEAPPSSITNCKDSKASQPLIFSVLNVDFNLMFTRLWHHLISISRVTKDISPSSHKVVSFIQFSIISFSTFRDPCTTSLHPTIFNT
ncbi:hypothetical protein ACB094_11G169500 [Castanea mollissima]